MNMAYTTNPHIGKVRARAVHLVRKEGWSVREVARHLGVSHASIVRWNQKAARDAGRVFEIPTRSSRPKTSPAAIDYFGTHFQPFSSPLNTIKNSRPKGREFFLGWLRGLEPPTPGTTNRCSNQLSYSHHITMLKIANCRLHLLTSRADHSVQSTFGLWLAPVLIHRISLYGSLRSSLRHIAFHRFSTL